MNKRVIKVKVERPACEIKGFFPPKTGERYGAMCGKVGVGGRSCHYEGACEHQRPQQANGEG